MKKTLVLTCLLLLCVGWTTAQIQVKGIVVDEKNDALIGATVQIKGTNQGTTTDINGNFTLSTEQNAILVVTYIGMSTQEVQASANLKVVLISDSEELEELVVTGLGTATDRRKVAISVESVSEDALKRVPSKSIDGALIGRVAGAQIQSISGQPGQQANIILRGINSLGSTQPMILVDGVEVNSGGSDIGTGNISSRLADLDMSNVERVEVIQGAAAATIYGAQGANGVIQIFTKKGKAGQRTNISYSTALSLDNALRGNLRLAEKHFYPTTADGYIADGAGNKIEVSPKTGFWTKFNETVLPESNNNKPFKEKTYDHLDQYFKKNVLTQTHSLNIVGASGTIDYALGFSILNQESPIHGKYDKKNLSINLGSEIFKGFTIRSSTQLIMSTNTTGGVNNRNNIYSGLGQALSAPAFVDLNFIDDKGNPNVNWDSGSNSVHPQYTYKFKEITADVKRVIQGINANYKINKFFELDYKYGIDHYRYDYTDFTRNQMGTNTPGKGLESVNGKLIKRAIQETQQNSLLSALAKIDFKKDFNLKLPLQSTTQIAYDWRHNSYYHITADGTGYDQNPPFTLSTSKDKTNSDYISEFVTFGYLINQKFDYANLAGASFGIRSDYSSAFGAASAPFTFPRADLYFRLSELLKQEFIYELKLRAAYGEAGIQPQAYDRIVSLSSATLGDAGYLYLPSTFRNPQLEVERTRETEFGLDYGFSLAKGVWLNKLSGSVVYWTRKSFGSIYTLDTAPSKGAAGFTDNAIDLSSTGLQLSLDLNAYSSKKFDWVFGARFSKGKTMVDKISNKLPIVVGAAGAGQTSIVEGEPVGAFFGTRPLASLDEKNSKGERYIDEANIDKFELVNGMVVNKTSKQVQFTSEQEKIGDATPDFSISFFNDFTICKNLLFSFQLDWVQGAQVYNATKQWLHRDRVHGDFDKEISINGEQGAWVAYYNSLYNTSSIHQYFVEDASFLRLRNISLSYDFGHLFNGKVVKGLLLTASAKNLFTVTNYSGIDPEAAGTVLNNPLYRGIDLWSIPNMRSYNIGLTVNF